MKKKTVGENIALKKHLATIFPRMVEDNQIQLLRSANDRLLTLFWLTGTTINEYCYQNKSNDSSKKLIQSAARKMEPAFGAWFTKENMQMMSLFAEQFPSRRSMAYLAPFISWEHLQVLLPLKNVGALLFYTKLTLEQDLGVSDLRRQVAANLYASSKVMERGEKKTAVKAPEPDITGRPERKYMDIVALGVMNRKGIINIFKTPVKAFLRPLVIPSKNYAPLFKITSEADNPEKDLPARLSAEAEKFRACQGRFLYSGLNSLLWQIGKQLSGDISLGKNKTNSRKSIINKASRQLKKYGRNFSTAQLNNMLLFAEQFPDSGMASIIGGLISWEQLLVILPIKDLEERLFYIRLAAGYGLSANALHKKIANKAYEKSTLAGKPRPVPMFTTTSICSITGKGKTRDISFSVDIYRDSNGPVPANVFSSAYFVDFINAL